MKFLHFFPEVQMNSKGCEVVMSGHHIPPHSRILRITHHILKLTNLPEWVWAKSEVFLNPTKANW